MRPEKEVIETNAATNIAAVKNEPERFAPFEHPRDAMGKVRSTLVPKHPVSSFVQGSRPEPAPFSAHDLRPESFHYLRMPLRKASSASIMRAPTDVGAMGSKR